MREFAIVAAECLGADAGDVEMVSNGVNKIVSVCSPTGKVFVRFSPETLHPKSNLLGEAALLTDCIRQGLPCCEVVEVGNTLVSGPILLAGATYHWIVTCEVVGKSLGPKGADAYLLIATEI